METVGVPNGSAGGTESAKHPEGGRGGNGLWGLARRSGVEICRSGVVLLSAFRYGIRLRSMAPLATPRIPQMHQARAATVPGVEIGSLGRQMGLRSCSPERSPQVGVFVAAMTARMSSPYFSSFAGPMPLTRCRAARDVG